MRLTRYIILLIVMIHLLTAGTTGKLTGLISDKNSGEALIGCNVIVTDTDLGTASNALGEYFILNIPPGIYTIKFSMIGYESLILQNVNVLSIETLTFCKISDSYPIMENFIV